MTVSIYDAGFRQVDWFTAPESGATHQFTAGTAGTCTAVVSLPGGGTGSLSLRVSHPTIG